MDLSVIIPVYNMQGYIAACLRSVTRCPGKNIDMECLVIDDGSNDDTAAIVKRYIQRDSRIKLITKEHSGVPDARNRGIGAAKGRYIMFLDADDRLCEDAWENIEAAVEEEYADFVAFSYIKLYGNGRMKAQMLPLSEVVSTDEQTARRLMYADSALSTCRGKIFKSDIIRDNNIIFRRDLPVGRDFLFVAEYFGHCQSYMMTKAMVVYYLHREVSAVRSYGIEAILGVTRILHDFSIKAAARYNDSGLTECIKVYYLNVLTDIFYEYAKEYRHDAESLCAMYHAALDNDTVIKILDEAKKCHISSIRKRYEYRLLRNGNVRRLRRYFSLRSIL